MMVWSKRGTLQRTAQDRSHISVGIREGDKGSVAWISTWSKKFMMSDMHGCG